MTRYDVPFFFVDTGGFAKESEDPVLQQVIDQTFVAISEADLLIALFDGKAGLHPEDDDIVQLLRRAGKPVFYAVNKCDGKEGEERSFDFYRLGVETLHSISALHGYGVKALLSEMFEALPNVVQLREDFAKEKAQDEAAFIQSEAECDSFVEQEIRQAEKEELGKEGAFSKPMALSDDASSAIGAQIVSFAPVFIPGAEDLSEKEYERQYKTIPLVFEQGALHRAKREAPSETAPEEPIPIECIRMAIIGRPNVGKSSLLNAFLKEQRAVTSPIAGTTRDAIDAKLTWEGQDYVIIDTAGLRKQARVIEDIERYSTLCALRALRECDVAVLVIDGPAGATEQDAKILGIAHEQGKGIVLAVNKWDLVEKNHRTVTEFKANLKEVFAFAPYTPIGFISAKSGRRCSGLLADVRQVAQERLRKVATGPLNRCLQSAIDRRGLSTYRGQRVKLYFAAQIGAMPPRFALFFNYPKAVHFSHLRHLKNAIREEFGFSGTDIKLVCRKR